MMTRLDFVVPMPPSLNTIYVPLPGGGVRLSDDANEYKRVFLDAVVEDNLWVVQLPDDWFDPWYTYEIRACLFFERVKKRITTRGESPLLELDADNRWKLLLDVIKTDIAGIDDRNFRPLTIDIVQGAPERVEVRIIKNQWPIC